MGIDDKGACAMGTPPPGRRWLVNRRLIRAFRQAILLGLLALGAVLAAAACAGDGSAPISQEVSKTGDRLERVVANALPSFALSGGGKAQDVYRFAASNSEILRYIPCYCGCVTIGHTSNEDCYIATRHPDDTITFTSHAAT